MHEFKFYYRLDKYGKKYFVETKFCKYPKRTKIYKSLETDFNCGFVEAYGFEAELPF